MAKTVVHFQQDVRVKTAEALQGVVDEIHSMSAKEFHAASGLDHYLDHLVRMVELLQGGNEMYLTLTGEGKFHRHCEHTVCDVYGGVYTLPKTEAQAE